MENLYRTLLRAGSPALRLLLLCRQLQGKEDKARLAERRGVPGRERPPGSLLWIHAASVGEAVSARILIAELQKRYPAFHILMTTGTVTSARLMEESLPPRALHQYYPLDNPDWTARFLDHWRPDIVLWMESELWPCMLLEIAERNIPAFLVNARLSEKSFSRWQKTGGLARRLLACFSAVLAQTEEEAGRYRALGAAHVVCTDNLKYAAAPLPVDTAARAALTQALQGRPLWLYASTHAGEEDLALSVHEALREKLPGLLTVIVPRHPRRGAEIAALCRLHGHQTRQRGESRDLPAADDGIYIADTLGELGLFYSLAPVACIGRSFSDDGGGGHNPVEAVQLGCGVLHGPHVQNLAQIYRDMNRDGAALRVDTPAALRENLLFFLTHPQALKELQDKGAQFAKGRQAAIRPPRTGGRREK